MRYTEETTKIFQEVHKDSMSRCRGIVGLKKGLIVNSVTSLSLSLSTTGL